MKAVLRVPVGWSGDHRIVGVLPGPDPMETRADASAGRSGAHRLHRYVGQVYRGTLAMDKYRLIVGVHASRDTGWVVHLQDVHILHAFTSRTSRLHYQLLTLHNVAKGTTYLTHAAL